MPPSRPLLPPQLHADGLMARTRRCLCSFRALAVTVSSMPLKNLVPPLALIVAMLLAASVGDPPVLTADPAKQTSPAASGSVKAAVELPWAEVLEAAPDAKVVTDEGFRTRIAATGLPWRVRDKGTGIEMLLVPPGEFVMGKIPVGGATNSDKLTAHEAVLTKPFYLGRYEVTDMQWPDAHPKQQAKAKAWAKAKALAQEDAEVKRLMTEGLTRTEAVAKAKLKDAGTQLMIDGPPQYPLVDATWNDCARFCKKAGLRLPTEAEWEYACLGGMREFQDDVRDAAWHRGNSGGETHPVGTKKANTLGFHDMRGNVSEWCADWYGEDYYKKRKDGVIDPVGPGVGSSRVLRGGSFKDHYGSMSFCLDRSDDSPGSASPSIGFRVARTPR